MTYVPGFAFVVYPGAARSSTCSWLQSFSERAGGLVLSAFPRGSVSFFGLVVAHSCSLFPITCSLLRRSDSS